MADGDRQGKTNIIPLTQIRMLTRKILGDELKVPWLDISCLWKVGGNVESQFYEPSC
jgi:hypothetical protein